MPSKKISTQERDRAVRRYNELIVKVTKYIDNEFALAVDEHFTGELYTLINAPEKSQEGVVVRSMLSS